jgi:hypothetical protein
MTSRIILLLNLVLNLVHDVRPVKSVMSTLARACHFIEVLNVKQNVFVLLLFASLPDCGQNQTAVSDTLRLLSDF